jgi:hypothetical protein
MVMSETCPQCGSPWQSCECLVSHAAGEDAIHQDVFLLNTYMLTID